jgi:hypothetical protein
MNRALLEPRVSLTMPVDDLPDSLSRKSRRTRDPRVRDPFVRGKDDRRVQPFARFPHSIHALMRLQRRLHAALCARAVWAGCGRSGYPIFRRAGVPHRPRARCVTVFAETVTDARRGDWRSPKRGSFREGGAQKAAQSSVAEHYCGAARRRREEAVYPRDRQVQGREIRRTVADAELVSLHARA